MVFVGHNISLLTFVTLYEEFKKCFNYEMTRIYILYMPISADNGD